MTRELIIKKLIKDASTHNPDEVMCFIAGHRKDNGKDYYTYGEFLDSFTHQHGSVWDDLTKETIDLIIQHPEYFKKDFEEENTSNPQ